MLLDAVLPQTARKSRSKKAGDNHLFSLLKSISWRIVGTIDTMLIAYFVTGKVQMALSIGFVEVFTKLTLYYLHERIWVLAKRKFKTDDDDR